MPNCAVFGCNESTTKRVCEKNSVCEATADHQEDDKVVLQKHFEVAENFEAPLKIRPNIKYFSIPQGRLGLTWKIAGGRDPDDYAKSSTFCSKHFAKSAYNMQLLIKRGFNLKGIRALKEDAAPTLSLPKKEDRREHQQNREKRILKRNSIDDAINPNSHADKQLEVKRRKLEETNKSIENLVQQDETQLQHLNEHQPKCDEQLISQTSDTAGVMVHWDIYKRLSKNIDNFKKNQVPNLEYVDAHRQHEGNNNKSDQDVVVSLSFLKNIDDMVTSMNTKNANLLQDNVNLKKISECTKKKLLLSENITASLKQEKEELAKQLEGDTISQKTKEKIIRETLQPYFSKAQFDRLLLKKQSHWSEEDLNSSILLLCLNVRSYQVLRLKYQYPLPSITCVKRYLSSLHCVPGLMVPTLKLMEARAASLKKLEKLLVVSFDEVKIHSNCCYYAKQDRVLGPNKNAQVVFVRPLFGDWGNPVFYEFDYEITSDFVKYLSEKLHQAGGWITKVWTCDLGPSNRKLHTELGIGVENQVVSHSVTNEKMFFMSDSPHHLKNARSHLIDSGIVLNPNDKKADQRIACKMPLCQLANLTPMAEMTKKHKLTWRHIECRGMDRQIVKIAAETCSQSTAECLIEAGDKKLITSPHYKATSEYCMMMDSFFDMLNVKNDVRVVPGLPNKPIMPTMLPYGVMEEEQKEILNKIAEFVSEMRLANKARESKLLPFQVGIIINCKAVPLLYEDLKENYPDEEVFLFTYKLNQDCLEILFSILRALGVTVTCPTNVDFCYRITKHMLMKTPTDCLRGLASKLNVCVDAYVGSLASEVGNELLNLNKDANDEDEEESSQASELQSLEHQIDEEQTSMLIDGDSECLHQAGEKTDELVSQEELLDDTPTSALYEDGLTGVASIVAFRCREKFPELQAENGSSSSLTLPPWVEHFSKKGRLHPSAKFVHSVKLLDSVFLMLHGNTINKDFGILEAFCQQSRAVGCKLPQQVIQEVGKLRLDIRLYCVNKRKDKTKDAVLKVNTAAKSDKNSRTARVNFRWTK